MVEVEQIPGSWEMKVLEGLEQVVQLTFAFNKGSLSTGNLRSSLMSTDLGVMRGDGAEKGL